MKAGRLLFGVLVALALAATVGAAPAAASTTIVAPPSATYPYQQWADESAVPTAPITLSVVEDASLCEGTTACTGPGDPIWIIPFGSERITESIFRHELGHQFDYYVMEDWARARFETLIGDTRPWTEDPNAPNEKFADAWKFCSYSTTIRHAPLNYANLYRPTPLLHRKVCHLIEVVAGVRMA